MHITAPKHTPWGAWDYCRQLAPGIFSVGTPSHGGIFVSAEVNKRIPEYAQQSAHNLPGETGQWYEEDCDWCIPFTFLAAEIKEGMGKNVEMDVYTSNSLETAAQHMRSWHPDVWERMTGKVIPSGQSYVKDERAFFKTHHGELAVASAADYPARAWAPMFPGLQDGEVAIWSHVVGEPSGPNERRFIASAEAYHEAMAKTQTAAAILIASIGGVREVTELKAF